MESSGACFCLYCIYKVRGKEVIKEHSTSRNLSATATGVLQCTSSLGLSTCPVAASLKEFYTEYIFLLEMKQG
jgi:hypothetical protein